MSLFVCMHSLCCLQSQMMDWCVKFCLVLRNEMPFTRLYTVDVVYRYAPFKKDLRYLPSIKIQEQTD